LDLLIHLLRFGEAKMVHSQLSEALDSTKPRAGDSFRQDEVSIEGGSPEAIDAGEADGGHEGDPRPRWCHLIRSAGPDEPDEALEEYAALGTLPL
jgi:hypothetical protein